MPGRLLTIEQASEYLGDAFTVSALRSKVQRRQIPFVKVAGRVYFDVRQLERWIESNTTKVAS